MIARKIPASSEELPVLGLGTWQTFNVSGTPAYNNLEKVLDEFHRAGGRLIDSSPMYGRSEQVIGDITESMDTRNDFFYATKVWTTGKQAAIRQMQASMQKLKRSNIDLMQIHNLTDWKIHLETLKDWKDAGIIKYIGITHYTDAMHEELARIITTEEIDFVQFNYSILSVNAEKHLLPVAAEHGVATIINRPFGAGNLFEKVKHKPLPDWATDLDIHSWSAYFLKFIISHPSVSCAIPATSNAVHAADNYRSGSEPLPDPAARKKMLEYVRDL